MKGCCYPTRHDTDTMIDKFTNRIKSNSHIHRNLTNDRKHTENRWGKKTNCSIDSARIFKNAYGEKKEIRYLLHIQHINFRWIKVFNKKGKSFRRQYRRTRFIIGVENNFFNRP